MKSLTTLDASIISFIILTFIYVNVYNRSEKFFVQYRLFINLVRINMLLIIVDLLGRVFNALPGTPNLFFNVFFNTVLYLSVPLGPILWIQYTNYQVFHDSNRLKKNIPYLIIALINAVLTVISLKTGWFFSVDQNNFYHRGSLFWLHMAIIYLLILYAFFFVLYNRKKVEKRYFNSLLLFFVPQSIGTTIQIIDYGSTYNWAGMMLSLLVLYFNIQDRSLNTDYLTGVYNRRQLDEYIKAKIKNSTQDKSFSAIMIDLNEFKKINDLFGHDTGDEALRASVKIIRKGLRQNDFVARYGGDEFIVIVDVDSYEVLEHSVVRIIENAENHNKSSQSPYKISFSMGYDIYKPKSKMNSDDFIKHIDALMYKDKKQR